MRRTLGPVNRRRERNGRSRHLRMAENAVGRRNALLMLAIDQAILLALARALCHSGSAWKAFHFFSRSASNSQASR